MTFSGVKPNLFCNSFSGAEAPNVSMPRAHLAEFAIVAAQGLRNVGELIAIVRDDGDRRLPDVARQVLANQIERIETAVAALERQRWPGTRPTL